MATSRNSSAPMFTNLMDLAAERTEDTGVDPIYQHPGANQFLQAPSHDDQSTLAPGGNRVQPGAVDLINRTSPVGQPNPLHPYGAQTS